MASVATIKAVGDWNRQMAVPISNALSATVELTGRSGRQACEMAMVYMARSARAMTPQAKKNRKIIKGSRGASYVEKYTKTGKIIKRYKNQYPDKNGNTWDDAKEIKSRGLAKRSWFWGISKLIDSKVISGVNTVHEFLSDTACGLIMTNRLKYLMKIMPAGFEQAVAAKASNQIMAQNAKKLERKFSFEIPRLAAQRSQRAQKRLAQAFKQGRAA
jgi:hypothetical protein